MLAATSFGIFFIPLFYLTVRRWVSKKRPLAPEEIAHQHDHDHDVAPGAAHA
jgi:multidrug efflux pump